MQTKHLHLFLLLLGLIGCSHPRFEAQNPYLIDKEKFVLPFEANAPANLWVGAADLRINGYTVPAFRVRLYPLLDDFWEFQWENEHREPLPLAHQTTHRTLVSLVVQDSLSEMTERAIPLPGGQGVAFYLESKSKVSYSVTLAGAKGDTLFAEMPQKVGENLYSIAAPGGGVVMVGASEGIATVARISDKGKAPVWRFVLNASREPQVILTAGTNMADTRRQAQYYLNALPEVVHARTMEQLAKHAAFTLHTSDDKTNRLFALLSEALVQATPRLKNNTKLQIEDNSQMAAALFLASRERPQAVFAPVGIPPTEQQRRDNLRWGSGAYAAVVNYGIADEDSVKRQAGTVITELSRLQGEYSTADLEAVSDESVKDSLMRLASAHVRLAGLMTVGETISAMLGDNEGQGNFRRDALRASRRAQGLFSQSARTVIMRQRGVPSRLESVLDTSFAAPEEDSLLQTQGSNPTYPDTGFFLAAGARYGFNWLDERPVRMWNKRLAVGGFTWQRWVAYKFRNDLKLTATGDLDSLAGFLFEGPIPGLLTTDPQSYGEPSLLVMAAALQNLSEIYLGIQPNAFEHKVFIEPRLPASWGHTAARVPFGPGELTVEYSFAQHYAVVGMANMPYDVAVYFGYPLDDGGYERAQFVLEKGQHPQRIDLEQDERDNRLRVRVTEVP
jgi:hypothetical protein